MAKKAEKKSAEKKPAPAQVVKETRPTGPIHCSEGDLDFLSVRDGYSRRFGVAVIVDLDTPVGGGDELSDWINEATATKPAAV